MVGWCVLILFLHHLPSSPQADMDQMDEIDKIKTMMINDVVTHTHTQMKVKV